MTLKLNTRYRRILNSFTDKDKKYAALYILITLSLSWIYALFVFSRTQFNSYFIFVMFFPAVVALILNRIRYRSWKTVLSPLLSRIHFASLLFGIMYPILFIGVLALAGYLSGLATVNTEKLSGLFDIPLSPLIVIGILLIFGEEYGWRGFLLQTLARIKGKAIATGIVGIVWAVWHAPFVYALAYRSEMEYPFLFMLVQISAVFTFSYPFAYSYFISNNIVSPLLFHLVWNIYNPIVLGNVYRHTQGIMEGNLLIINGEGLAGIVFGIPFLIWFLRRQIIPIH